VNKTDKEHHNDLYYRTVHVATLVINQKHALLTF